MGINRLPDSKGWDKITEEAFSSSETHVFSDEYCRRRAELQRGVTMKRTSSGNKRYRTGIAAAAAAFILIPGATIAGTHLLTHKSNDNDKAAEVIVEPTFAVPAENVQDTSAAVRKTGEDVPLNWYNDKVFACVDSFGFSNLDTDGDPVNTTKELTNIDTSQKWKIVSSDVTYKNESDETVEIDLFYNLCSVKDGELQSLTDPAENNDEDMYDWHDYKCVAGKQTEGDKVVLDPGETSTVERVMLLRESDLNMEMYIAFAYETGIPDSNLVPGFNYASLDSLGAPGKYCVRVDEGEDMAALENTVPVSENTDAAAEEETTAVSEGNEQKENIEVPVVTDHRIDFSIIPYGYATYGYTEKDTDVCYYPKFNKEGEGGGITPCVLSTTNDINSVITQLDSEQSGINPDCLPHVKKEEYEVKTLDNDTPDTTVYVLYRNVSSIIDQGSSFDRDVIVKFNDSDYFIQLYLEESVTKDELDQFISGMKIVPME
ncbi:MAG: hypothetical protein GXY08_14475 [Ruminococcus sp.]|nr:hypothetical protein [Ruminococcus sp.]